MSRVVSLTVKCPHCLQVLNDESHLINNHPAIKVELETSIKQKGFIWLSSIYGDYNYSCEFHIPDDDVVKMYCPFCHEDLKRKNVECDACGAPVISFLCNIGGRVSICSRNGCKNHYVVFEDLDSTIRRFYDEYGYV
jgi:methionyl-tRNA synthetase